MIATPSAESLRKQKNRSPIKANFTELPARFACCGQSRLRQYAHRGPALIVSMAAGMMVSKAGIEGSSEKALFGQLSFYPQALGMAAFVMAVVALLPGMPHLVFAALAAAGGVLAYSAWRAKETARMETARKDAAKREIAPPDEPISSALALDLLRVELGYGLLPLINDVKGHRVTTRSNRYDGSSRPRWALSCRPFASSTICSLPRTSTRSASKRWSPVAENCMPAKCF